MNYSGNGSLVGNGSAVRHAHDRVADLIIYYGQLTYPPILLTLCVLGNAANFVVIGKVCSGSSISVYFRWLAIADTLAAGTYLTRIWIHAVFRVLISGLNVTCKLITFTNYTAGDVAIWLIVAVTADRLVAVVKPFVARRVCTARSARLVALAILLLMAAKNATIFFSFAVVVRPKETKCGYQNEHPLMHFEKHVRPMLTFTISGLIPVVFILLLNSAVVAQLIRHRRQMRLRCDEPLCSRPASVQNGKCRPETAAKVPATRKCAEAAARKKNSETAAVVIVLANSIMFFVMVLPQFVVNVFKQFPYASELRAVQVFTTFLMYCNHSSNFYISYAASSAYRRKVRRTLGCKRSSRAPSSSVRYSTNTEIAREA